MCFGPTSSTSALQWQCSARAELSPKKIESYSESTVCHCYCVHHLASDIKLGHTCSGVVGGTPAGECMKPWPWLMPSGDGEPPVEMTGVPGMLFGDPRFDVVRDGGAPSCRTHRSASELREGSR